MSVQGGGPIGLAIRRPIGVLVGVLLTMMFGVLSLTGIPIQLTPDVTTPTLTVQTTWPGAAPAEVEREILQEQEVVLKGLQGLERMIGEARRSNGSITLEFRVGTDIDDALVRVTNRLAQVPAYPEAATEPVVSTSDNNGAPLAVLIIKSRTTHPIRGYRTWVDDEVVARLERVPGISSILLIGGQESEVEVAFDPEGLAGAGVPVSQLESAVSRQLRDVSAGTLDLGKRAYVVRAPVAPDAITDLESGVLRVEQDGTVLRIRDVASVQRGLRKRDAFVMSDGEESMVMLVWRESGYNVLEVTEQLRDTVDELQKTRLGPRGLQFIVASDQSAYINGALDLVQQNLVLGGLLAVVVLLAFLRSVPAATVVATAIPICTAGTLVGMSLAGRSINVVSLAGVAFAVGMVVDNAIVVLENIDTWRRRGVSPAEAALRGTSEVWGALVASTLTTAAVFLPIIAWEDEVGELLRDVAVAISVAVVLSLFVSVLVIPSFSALLLKKVDEEAQTASLATRIRDGIGGIAGALARRWWASAGLTLGAVGLAIVTTAVLVPPMEYLPGGNRNLLFGILITPPGYNVEELDRLGTHVQRQIVPHIGVEKDGLPAVERTFFSASPRFTIMGVTAEDPERVGELLPWLRGIQGNLPGVFSVVTQASLFGRGLSGGRTIELDIVGGDVETLAAVGGRLFGAVREAIPGVQVRPQPSLDISSPELRVVTRREQAAAVGLGPLDVGRAADALVDGAIVGELAQEGAPQVDVVIRPRNGGVTTPAQLAAAPLATPTGAVVPLGAVAELVEGVAPETLRHIERRRAITLGITPPEDLALETALAILRDDIVGKLEVEGLPEGVRLELAGAADKLSDAQSRMMGVLALAVVISFLLMAALFEDFLAPVVILVTVPLAAAGGVIGLRLVDLLLAEQPLDMMTALGFVILIGVVVNNAILVVDGALARLREGVIFDEAVQDAVAGRVRPILMSALTSLAGLLPLVLFPGSGSELYRGVGSIVLGGLALSTVLTLFVIPAAFTTVWKLARRA